MFYAIVFKVYFGLFRPNLIGEEFMKKFILAVVLMAASNVSFSQVPPEPAGDPLPIIPGPGDDHGTIGDEPRPKSPILVPSVYQDGHTLYLYSGCTGATLRLLDADEEEVFSTEITDEMDEICIPNTLVGTYRLEIIRGAFTFYCYIEL